MGCVLGLQHSSKFVRLECGPTSNSTAFLRAGAILTFTRQKTFIHFFYRKTMGLSLYWIFSKQANVIFAWTDSWRAPASAPRTK